MATPEETQHKNGGLRPWTASFGQPAGVPSCARDPLDRMMRIVKDNEISDANKEMLLGYSETRFTNRRKMAYFALYGILASMALILLAGIVDGIADTSILTALERIEALLVWLEGFLVAIVASYYGVSSFRPSS